MVLYQGKFSQPYSQYSVWAWAYVRSRLPPHRQHPSKHISMDFLTNRWFVHNKQTLDHFKKMKYIRIKCSNDTIRRPYPGPLSCCPPWSIWWHTGNPRHWPGSLRCQCHRWHHPPTGWLNLIRYAGAFTVTISSAVTWHDLERRRKVMNNE